MADRPPTRDDLTSRLRIFPSTDQAFTDQVLAIAAADPPDGPESFQARLRRFHPRTVVRRRELANEPELWYVYRDGAWASHAEAWWLDPHVGRIVLSSDGWVLEANTVARGLLGLADDALGDRHFTDFVAPGTLRDAEELYGIIAAGVTFQGTVLIRPLDGHVLAIDLRALQQGDRVIGELRLAADVPPFVSQPVARPSRLDCRPGQDAAFGRYATSLLEHMPEPTVDGLALRLRRLYPHAAVRVEGDGWIVEREPASALSDARWWESPGLPRVAYDAQGLILEASPAAQDLLGSPLVGHHWHEFVTTGSTDAVDDMIAIIREAGGAVSRFRMPDATGSLIEFDSFTSVDADVERLVTIMRPLG